MDAVVNGLTPDQQANVLPVLFTLTAAQKTGGYPNASGHLAMAKQLADAVVGSTVSTAANWPYGAISGSVMAADFPNKTSLDHSHGYTNPTTLSAGQQAIRTKVTDTSNSMTWLFMGDSITHGSAWTGGYDTLAQLFEKFVKDDLGRTQDLVINAGSSGATTASTINDLNRRLVKYDPDVVVLMLGTNDASSSVSENTYKANLRAILDKIIAKGATAVLRTPPPTSRSGYDIATYAQYVRDVAAESAYDGQVILVDQYELWTENDWSGVFSRDTLHPDEAGHLWFAHQLIKELALWNENYSICRLEYVEMKELEKIEIPGYTQMTDMSELDENKGYLIVSQDAQGSLYALYPSVEGETLGAGALVKPAGADNDGARAAKLTVKGTNVSAVWLKDNSAQDMNKLLFTIKRSGSGYLFQAFNGRHLNMQNYMFTEGSVTLTVTSRGTAAPGAFQIRNGSANRVLDFTKTGDPNAFYNSGENINTWGTDFWCPRSCKMPIYLFASDTAAIPTAREGIEALLEEIKALNQADYTSASWKNLQAAKAAAETALASGEPDGDAAVYVTARDALRDARDGLNKKPTPPTVPSGATKIADWKTMVPKSGTTQNQPYIAGTTGGSASNNFRIPAIITLQHQQDTSKNGRLVTAIDARWNHAGDACGLDTLVSYSDDDGANWKYNFPNYFGDSVDTYAQYGTAFIDPVLVEDLNGTIYLMVDIWPGGVALNTAPNRPAAATGYETINGTKRLVLYTAAPNASSTAYDYYVGDFTNGYAPVYEPIDSADDAFSGYYVDEYYYLYYTNGSFAGKNPNNDKIYCQRLGANNTWVQQNVFFYNATLHVRDASYLSIVTSTDGGETWGKPQMINDQVRTGADRFYGVGPGSGLCMEDGTIILPVYTWSTERAGFIYSKDNGATWTRGSNATTDHSSESCLVQISDTVIRHFYRDTVTNKVRYTDHTWNGAGWTTGTPVTTAATKTTGCQLSAIKYSKKINGKDAIIVSTAASGSSGRNTGKLYVFLVNNDANHTMELYNTYSVTANGVYYCYSSLSETKDGDIALLYEHAAAAVTFKIIPFTDLVPTLAVAGWEGVYNGTARTVTVTTNPNGATLQYSTNNGSTWSGTQPTFTDAGTYTVTVKATWSGNVTRTASATVKINKATPTISITSEEGAALTTGQEITLVVRGVPDKATADHISLACSNTADGHDPTITLTKQSDGTYTGTHQVEQGSHTFTATYSESANYVGTTASYSVTVSDIDVTVKPYVGDYDGKPHTITVTKGAGVQVAYRTAETGEYSLNAPPTFTNAGTYTIYYQATKDGASTEGSANVTISKATPTITIECDKKHSGDSHEILTTALPLKLTIKGVPAQDQGQFTLTTFNDAVRNLERKSNGDWVASPNIPPITRTYHFIAVFDPTQDQEGSAISSPNYERATAEFVVTISRPADEVIDFNFNFVSSVVVDAQVDTKGTLTIPYDGAAHSPLEALTYDKGLVLTYHVPVEYISPDDESGLTTWTDVAPTFRQPGEYTVTCMASPANSPVVKVLTVVLNIVDGNIATDLVITPSETELTGGGELTLTVTGMPAAGALTVTCDRNVKITETTRGTYTVTLPDRDEFYTFTASYSGAGSYQSAEASCTVNVTSAASLVAKLESLILNAGDAAVALSPAFKPNTTTYQATVGGAESVTVAAAGNQGTTVVVRKGGTVCADGIVPLDEGKNTVIITVSDGPNTTNYTVTITRVADKSALTDAIAAANTAKQGVVASNQTAADVAKDTKFVTTAEMKALTDAIAAARAIANKADATQAAVDEAVTALNAAVDAFKAAIKTGTNERPAGSGSVTPSNPTTPSTLPVTTSTSNKNGTPTTETTATPAASTKNGEATSTVNSTVGNEIVKQAADKNSNNVVITPEIKGSVSKTEVSILASTVEQIGKRTNANLTVTTPVASVTIPNSALNDLSKPGGDVKVIAERIGSTVELSVTAGGKTAGSIPGGMKVTVPVAGSTPGTVAVLVREDGTQQVIRKSIAGRNSVTIPLDGSARVKIVDNSKSFIDVPATNWAADAVSFVSSHELFNGTSSTTFSPDLPMSRSMLAVVLHNLEDNPPQALTGTFSDVDNTKWYAEGVAWASKEGIVTGYGGGKFDPNGDITREQLAVMLWRYAGKPNAKSGTLNFVDAAKISPWALEAMRWATEKGIINGKGSGILDPTGKATRAQAAQMLKNFLEKQ